MIAANELKRGNFVIHNGKITCCDSIVLAEVFDNYKRPKTWDSSDFDPIPLTPEMLDKNFNLHTAYWHINADGFNLLLWKDGENFTASIRHTGNSESHYLCTIKYLHQLQNLYFALTSKELEITI